MKKDSTYAQRHFNCYPTVRQKNILEIISGKLKRPQTDIVREAVHFWLRGKRIDDGLIYDTEDFMREYDRARGSVNFQKKSSEK
jgi:hypothetical protein